MMRPTFEIWVLRVAAAFALVWSILRAVQQAITLDEADTYFWFGGREAKFIWYPLPNNHVLNTLLIWLSTHVFGVSALTVRLPALLGAALYISVAYFLCRAITGRFALQFATLICLVYNPFVLDFFAAARGYSLANAFLMAALAIPVWHTRTGRKSVPVSSALASAAIGLSFASNLSFAFVDSAALLVIVIWAIRRRGADSMLRITGCCVLPALVVSLGMCGYPIAHYPREELWYGAGSLGEMTRSLVDASLHRLWAPLANVRSAQIRGIIAASRVGRPLCLPADSGKLGSGVSPKRASANRGQRSGHFDPDTDRPLSCLPACQAAAADVADGNLFSAVMHAADRRRCRVTGRIAALALAGSCYRWSVSMPRLAHSWLCLRYAYFGGYRKCPQT